jgi:hypothetical protein
MKSTYNAPKLIQHGNVEEITQSVGLTQSNDTIFINDLVLTHSHGSSDAHVVSCSGAQCTSNQGINNPN